MRLSQRQIVMTKCIGWALPEGQRRNSGPMSSSAPERPYPLYAAGLTDKSSGLGSSPRSRRSAGGGSIEFLTRFMGLSVQVPIVTVSVEAQDGQN